MRFWCHRADSVGDAPPSPPQRAADGGRDAELDAEEAAEVREWLLEMRAKAAQEWGGTLPGGVEQRLRLLRLRGHLVFDDNMSDEWNQQQARSRRPPAATATAPSLS